MIKNFLRILFLLLFPALLFSEAPSVSVSIDQDEIGLNEQAEITVELNQQAQKIKPPKSKGFDLAQAGQSQNSQVSIINGKVTQKTSFTYTFLLSPKKTGTLEIPPFEVTINQQSYFTKSLALKVVKGAKKKNKGSGGIFSPFEELFNEKEKVPEIFVRLVPSLNSAYQNQQVVVDVYLLSSDKDAFDYEYKETVPVRTDKAFLIDLTPAIPSNQMQVVRDGNFYRKLYERIVLFPIEAGQVAVSPPSLIAVTPYGQLRVLGDAVAVNSVRLKEESGISYIGNLEVERDKPAGRIDAGKDIELTVRMKGDGNLKSLSNPYGDLKIDGLFISSPETQLKLQSFKNGTAVFEQEIKYKILAQKAGDYAIPPVKINYYDRNIKPRAAEIGSFSLKVLDNKNIAAQKEYHYKNIGRPENFQFLLFNPLVILILVLFIMLPVASWFYGRHKTRMRTDLDYARNFLAGKKFSRYLSDARKSYEKGDYPSFYVALQKGVFYYLTDKLRLPQGIPFRELLTCLKERNFQDEVISAVKEINEECMTGAYSGKIIKADLDILLKKAETVFGSVH